MSLVDDGCLRLCFSFVIVMGPQRDRARIGRGIAAGIFDHIGNLLDINPTAALIELGRRGDGFQKKKNKKIKK